MLRVTDVLRLSGLRPDMKWMSPEDRDWYYRRGSMIHKAVALMDVGRLDWKSLHPRIVPYVQAAQKFRLECGGELVAQELEVTDLNMGTMGHLDAVYKSMSLRSHGRQLCLVDWKTNSVDQATQVQTAAYALMTTNALPHGAPVRFRCGVALHDDSSYAVTWYTDRAGDIQAWVGAVMLAKWRLRNGEKANDETAKKEELT